LSGLIHEKETSSDFEKSLERALAYEWDKDSNEYCILKKLKRHFDKSRRIPVNLVKRVTEKTAITQSKWFQAKQAKDFSIVKDSLRELVELYKEQISLFPEFACAYDALLDDYEEGMTSRLYGNLFRSLREKQTEIVRKIIESGNFQRNFLDGRSFDGDKQMAFCNEVIAAMGYDRKHGRVDFTEHPFTIDMGLSDVRITTKVVPENPLSCLYSCVHECGHALYTQNTDMALDKTPCADGVSLGFHESQSRLWENIVGRSMEFWTAFYPRFREFFPEQTKDISQQDFYRSVNHVKRSLIRTESDEATYNLHILLRYEMEKQLFSDSVTVDELPDLWNAKMKEYIGIEPANDAEGVLQDIHWYGGLFGYFPTYALGNLIGA